MKANLLSKYSSKQGRELIRTGKHTTTTAGFCYNNIQTNIVLLEKSNADKFKLFCQLNPVPCPVHYISSPNEFTATPLATNSDVRYDVGKYRVIENGIHTNTVTSLQEFPLIDYVTFYIGCSYTFEHALLNAGIPQRHIEQHRNVAMYTTNIPCVPIPPFDCNMIVSMRYIPFVMLKLTHDLCGTFPLSHGAPIWVGNPNKIGIAKLDHNEIGEYSTPSEGDVPVFWGCGVTTQNAIMSAKIDRVFSHYPGHMFISDIQTEPKPIAPSEMVVFNNPPNVAVSFVSSQTADVINKLQVLISNDLNNRGMTNLVVEGDLLKSCLYLSHSDTVAIISEFPCHFEFEVPYETDGIPGVFAVAKVLSSLGKKVTLLYSRKLMGDILSKCLAQFEWSEKGIELKSLASMASSISNDNPYDCLLTIEHSGPAKDGKYYTMKGVDITQYCGELVTEINGKMLFKKAISVGDGGNEWGMGKVSENVTKYVDKGDLIGNTNVADFLVSAGVSNWGGYAIAAGILAARNCIIHRRYVMNGVRYQICTHKSQDLFSKTEQRKLLSVMCELGIRDGMSKELGLRVDGLDIDVHEKVIEAIAQLLVETPNSN
ncbi:hypothetical protein LOD99_8387 [Oopsacas minuta]|uniref:D-glutamate cyclase-like C-terminal domain-containing protein n=1 Tax=Oopsacas minuta TaxID=111878 RepID=A0AAV7JGI9_9METZ|nr:hypothetical protein LOD99_8387 [Oopsacas minuta]